MQEDPKLICDNNEKENDKDTLKGEKLIQLGPASLEIS